MATLHTAHRFLRLVLHLMMRVLRNQLRQRRNSELWPGQVTQHEAPDRRPEVCDELHGGFPPRIPIFRSKLEETIWLQSRFEHLGYSQRLKMSILALKPFHLFVWLVKSRLMLISLRSCIESSITPKIWNFGFLSSYPCTRPRRLEITT
jgi:hypothetical protein